MSEQQTREMMLLVEATRGLAEYRSEIKRLGARVATLRTALAEIGGATLLLDDLTDKPRLSSIRRARDIARAALAATA